uniref:Secreted protein n=1 Tax=Schistosoma japonicum TaxID=6182 RepID=Q5BR02_SCHJA|nr:unknown [Schistosoma japonicum]
MLFHLCFLVANIGPKVTDGAVFLAQKRTAQRADLCPFRIKSCGLQKPRAFCCDSLKTSPFDCRVERCALLFLCYLSPKWPKSASDCEHH